MNITPFNVEQFDYVPYTLPSLDILVVAEKKEAIKILEQANEYLISTAKNYTRFLKEALEWREHEKEHLPENALEDINEKVKDLATNISIVIGTTQTLNDTVSRLSGKTKSSDIKSTTGNSKDSSRGKNAEELAEIEEELNKTDEVDQEKREQALKDINDVIKAIKVKTPTQTKPKNTKAQEERLVNASIDLLEAKQQIQDLMQAIEKSKTSTFFTEWIKDVVIGELDLPGTAAGIIQELRENPLLTAEEKDKLAKAEKELDSASDVHIYEGIRKTFETVTKTVGEAVYIKVGEDGRLTSDLAPVLTTRLDKEIEKVKQTAEQEAAVNDLSNTRSAIEQGRTTVADAISKINEAEAAGTITKEDAEKARKEAINKAAEALGMSEQDKENITKGSEAAAKELSDKYKDIQEREESGEITKEQAEKERAKAQSESEAKTKEAMDKTTASIKSSGSWSEVGETKINADGTATKEMVDASGQRITVTVDKNGSGTSIVKDKDGNTVSTGTVVNGKVTDVKNAPKTESGGTNSSNSGYTGGYYSGDSSGYYSGDSRSRPSSGGTNTSSGT